MHFRMPTTMILIPAEYQLGANCNHSSLHILLSTTLPPFVLLEASLPINLQPIDYSYHLSAHYVLQIWCAIFFQPISETNTPQTKSPLTLVLHLAPRRGKKKNTKCVRLVCSAATGHEQHSAVLSSFSLLLKKPELPTRPTQIPRCRS